MSAIDAGEDTAYQEIAAGLDVVAAVNPGEAAGLLIVIEGPDLR